MKIILFIDTTSSETIKIGLNKNGEEFIVEKQLNKQKAQIILPLIDKLLKKHNLRLRDISEINVEPGPGSFTGVRVGLTIANTIAFLLKISVNGKPVGDFAEPIYAK